MDSSRAMLIEGLHSQLKRFANALLFYPHLCISLQFKGLKKLLDASSEPLNVFDVLQKVEEVCASAFVWAKEQDVAQWLVASPLWPGLLELLSRPERADPRTLVRYPQALDGSFFPLS